jgi:hypothetical protein
MYQCTDKTPRLLRCAFLLCVQSSQTKLLCAVGTCFAPTSATNRKLITAFHNLAQEEPNHHLINYNEPYFVVSKLYPSQIVDDRAIPVIFKCGDPIQDWAVLEVDPSFKPGQFQYNDTIPLRDKDNALPQVTVASTHLRSIYCKIGLHLNNSVEFIEPYATEYSRVAHVFSKTVELDQGLYKGSSGCVMVDRNECAVAIHIESVYEMNKRLKIYEVVSESSGSHSSSRTGLIIFNIQQILDELNAV